MGILFDSTSRVFHLEANETSYLIHITERGHLAHLYWGRRIRSGSVDHLLSLRGRAFSPNPEDGNWNVSLDTLPQEYPSYGTSDFRHPAFEAQLFDGSTISNLRYVTHRIFPGKPLVEGLPSTYVETNSEAATLEIELADALTGLTVILSYTAYEKFDAITRSARFVHSGSKPLRLHRALSMSIDFPTDDYDLLQLSGAWARERSIIRRHLAPGSQSIESRRGASSHQQNPFVALLQTGATEDMGDVYGFSLVYSGNFQAEVEVDSFSTTRVSMGINPFDFSWLLEPGRSFQTPEVVLVYSSEGLGAMSRTYHRLYRTRLCRGTFRDRVRPVLVNNWEATYFQFNADIIEKIAQTGKELGIELFVLDDGWFGKRDDDRSSLGDWVVDRKKLPGGLTELVQRVRNLEMQFGLWFEPEMVSPDSDLYRAHPDWCLHVNGRGRTESRNQLILDLSREDVCNYIIRSVSDVLSSAPITYVKWDMNRHMTEIGSALLPPDRQRETAHRYMLGLYRVMDAITSAFPHVLFESCSGGGGRFDPGILYYMPQTWTSDNTDAVTRLQIQYGTSIVYPACTMGAHVSAVPNHQLHRTTSLTMRGHVAMSGNFGYELDLTQFTEKEKDVVRGQVAMYKDIRRLIQFGDLYRLKSPFDGNDAAWMFVDAEQKECIVFAFRVLAEANGPIRRVRCKGLRPDGVYRLQGTDDRYGGDELMYAGLVMPDLHGDFQSAVWRFWLEE